MVATALAPGRVQNVARVRTILDYKRGSCPRCEKPMLVLASQPNAPCAECYEAPIAIGSQPIAKLK